MYTPRYAWIFPLGIILLSSVNIHGIDYEFVFENDKIFQKCSKFPETNGIEDFADLSNLTIDYNDGDIYVEGSMTLVWNVNPTDRIQFYGEVLKFQRGTWQPTMLSILVKDFCKEQYAEGTFWYNAWSKYISPEDTLCLNNYKHVYHYEPTEIDNRISLPGNMEGLHKIRITLVAFDTRGVKNSATICIEVIGDFVKYKK